jgi:hypothetical protein
MESRPGYIARGRASAFIANEIDLREKPMAKTFFFSPERA